MSVMCSSSVDESADSPQILWRVHTDLPNVFPRNVNELKVVRHNVGIRPARATGLRVEKETMKGEKVVHAYGESMPSPRAKRGKRLTDPGVAGGGYVFSFGVARAARDLVDEYVYESPLAKL